MSQIAVAKVSMLTARRLRGQRMAITVLLFDLDDTLVVDEEVLQLDLRTGGWEVA